MKASEANLLRFLNGVKQFIIPIYQRKYSWSLNECKQLLQDIIKSGENDKISSYFIGSIVYIEKGVYQTSTIPKLLLIDGQQRLTTIFLLILALSKFVKGSISEMTSDKLINYYLVNREEIGEKHFKLVLNKEDKQYLFNLIKGGKVPQNASGKIIENYKFFEQVISDDNISKIIEGLKKLIIIDVSLEKDTDNPQIIFESLNSTGLELTQADLIRNFILMGLKKTEQDRLYSDYWSKIEDNLEKSELSSGLFDKFIRDYLTMKNGEIPNIKDVYPTFKNYTKNFSSVTELVMDVYKYSNYFYNIALGNESDKEIKNIFSDMNKLKIGVSYPFLLRVYEDYLQEEITKEEFIEILRYIESYIFRRAICGVPTNSLDKTFASLYKKIEKDNYLESFKAALVLMDSYRRFPTDEEFKEELIIKDVYNFRNKKYLLSKLENYDRKKESIDIEEYTIEHIMPQNENLSDEWKKELGNNWKVVHDKYLHTIGNLTLTGYNSELSDRSFKEKRDMHGGFADSPIRLNRYLAKLEHWNEEEILNRAKNIANLAIKIWSYPKVDEDVLNKYKEDRKKKSSEKIYTLQDHPYLVKGAPMSLLFNELRKRILDLDSSVKESILKIYIAYKSKTNFVDVVGYKSKLTLSLNIKIDEINDPKKICMDVSNKGRWGNGKTEVNISKFEDLDYAIFLIKQAFDSVLNR